MNQKNSLTYILVLLHLFLVPLVYFKTDVGPLPLSIEIILIPLLVIIAFWEYMKGTIKLNNVPVKPFVITFALFLLASLISLVKAQSLTPAIMEIARFISYVFLFLIVVKVDFSKKQYINFAKVFALAALIVGVYGILTYVFNFKLNVAGLYALKEAKGRVYSTITNPNYYSAFLNFVIPSLLLFAVVYFKNKKIQLFFFAFYGIYVVNLILTYTRAAWVTMACALVLVIIIMPKKFIKNIFKPHLLIASIVLFAVVMFLPDFQSRTNSAIYAIQTLVFPSSPNVLPGGDDIDIAGDEPSDEVDLVKKEEEATTNRAVVSRTTLWKTGWVMFKDNPIIGVGTGNYLVRYKEYVTKYPDLNIGHDEYSVHNSYLKVMAESGTIGILAFLSMYVTYFLYLARLYFKQNLLGQVVALGIFAGSATFMVQNLSNNLIFIPQLNIIFWIIAGLTLAFLYKNSEKSSDY
ncbi:O-antigen ligase family protein [Bacillus cihuensis]|uniref:O-antigen ligase family protein n=1 Tax=Bacillus cihuensis TaxID=1208599 RepID=UPI0003FE2AA6|nr:O-antigen ligase family protein [Bacillus cihuensis]